MVSLASHTDIFRSLVGRRVCFVPTPIDNPGDKLIDIATRQLLNDFGIDWFEAPSPPVGCRDTLLMFGGGTVGVPVATKAIELRKAAAGTGAPWVLLPSTAYEYEPSLATAEAVYVRDAESARIVPGSVVAADVAMAYRMPTAVPVARPAKVYLRKQGAGLWLNATRVQDPRLWISDPVQYVEFAASHYLIVTDILHLAIGCIVAGRRPVLLPIGTHKNRGAYEAFLHPFCDWADDPQDVGVAVNLGEYQ